MGHAVETFPQSYRVWICKEVSHFAGTNGMLSEVDWSVENLCSCCGCEEESTLDITQCYDPERTAIFKVSALTLTEWIEETSMDEALVW